MIRPHVVVAALVAERAVAREVIRANGGFGGVHGVRETTGSPVPTRPVQVILADFTMRHADARGKRTKKRH